MIRANAIAKRTITGQLLEIAMAQSFCAVMITDARLDGEGPVIEYCNAAMCEMTGYTEAELLGRSPRMLRSRPVAKPRSPRTMRLGSSWAPIQPSARRSGRPSRWTTIRWR